MNPFNPLDARLTIDPYPLYAELRTTEPVHFSAMGAYVLTRYEDVKQMLSNSDAFQHQYVIQQKHRLGDDVEGETYFNYFRRMIFVSDGTEHRRLRKLATQAFTPKRVRTLRHQAEHIANELLNQSLKTGGMDFVTDFAYPFPLRVIGSILGVPEADHEKIGEYATALNPVLEFLPMAPDVLAKANVAVEALAEYFTALATERRRAPTDDLFSALVHAAEDGDSLTNDELIANAILLYVAGHETTAGGSALALLSLYRNPEQLKLLREEPALIPNAIEELLRFDSPGQGTARVVVQDAIFGDVTVPAGNIVLGYLGAANRDPAVYPEPDVLDVQREFPNQIRPLTWGGGAHLCLGRLLALQELEVALSTLLTHCPNMLVEADEACFRETPLMRGLTSLPIRW